MKRMLGPAADEVAEMWRDQVRLYRYERQLKCIQKVEKMAQEAGLTPQAIPTKILFPLLEGASFEDNEDLHTMWAALLANAASPENASKVEASFIAILKQMSPDEAKLLNWFETKLWPESNFYDQWHLFLGHSFVHEYLKDLGIESTSGNVIRFERCFDALESYQLIRRYYFNVDSQLTPQLEPIPSVPALTERGCAFIQACRPPKRKKGD